MLNLSLVRLPRIGALAVMRTNKAAFRQQSNMTSTIFRDLAVIFGIGVGLIIVLKRDALLPPRFRGDETTIQELAQKVWETLADSSFSTVALAYRLVGLADMPVLAGVIGFAVGCVPYLLVLRDPLVNFAASFTSPIIFLGLVLTAVYMGTFSKEVFIVPIIIMFIVFRAGIWRMLFLIGAVCIYAEFVRTYWYFLAASMLALFFARRTFGTWKIIFWVPPVLVITGSVLISIIVGVPGDYFRSSVNVFREASGDVNSLIPRYVSFGEPLGGIVNNLISFVFLQVPLPLILKVSPYYILISLVIAALWVIFYSSVLRFGRRFTAAANGPEPLERAIFLLLGFVVTQSFFEPDYGSALKHLTPFIPVLLWVYLRSHSTHRDSMDIQRIAS